MTIEEKIFHNIWELFEEHECENWENFREFVHYATENYADVGFIGGNHTCDSYRDEDLEEMNGIYFITEEGVSNILFFPFTLNEFSDEIAKMEIFEE
jgi:hypothetical protein